MNAALWVVQALLALAFMTFGGMKLLMPHEVLVEKMAWAAAAPAWLPRFIGTMEVLGALGLILPAVTRVMPELTPSAAWALALVMVLAAGLHVVRGEVGVAVPSIVLLCLCGFVAVGRSWYAPFG